MPAFVNKDLCVGCRTCVNTCPVQAVNFTEEAKAEVDAENCISCGACASVCPMLAIELKD